MKRTFLPIALLLLILPISSMADVNYGPAARSIAMGGAGLAVLDDPLATAAINPAAMALSTKRFSLTAPSFDLHEEGASLSNLADSLDDVADTDLNGATTLATEFGSRNTRLGISAHAGVSLFSTAVGLGVEATAQILPNDAFAAFFANGTIPADLNAATADVTADAITYMPTVALGWKARTKGSGSMYLGVRGKYVKSRHYQETVHLYSDPDSGSIMVGEGPQVDVEDYGFGLDAGLIYSAPGRREMTYGLSINNLLRPHLEGIEQDALISLGMAFRPMDRVLVAADLVNVTGAYDQNAELRIGGELQVLRNLAIRAGYSDSGLSFGAKLFSLDVAFSADTPVTIGQTLRF